MSTKSAADAFANFLFSYEEEKNEEFKFGIEPQKMEWFCVKIDNAIKESKKILIWGDYDVDGIASSAMMAEMLQNIAEAHKYNEPELLCHIPGRADGYGISPALFRSYLKSFDLIITLDNGSHKEFYNALSADEKNKLLVFDHHPNGSFENEIGVFNPNANGDVKISTGLLVEEIHKGFRKYSEDYASCFSDDALCDLSAMTLISDMASLNNADIRKRIQIGIRQMNKRERLVYRKLLPEFQGEVSMQSVAFNLVPVINSIGRLILNPAVAVDLLIAKKDSNQARELIDEAIITNNFRKELTDTYSKIAYTQIETRGIENDPLIYVHIDDAPIGINGLIASNIFNRYGKDVIVTSRNFHDGGMIVGSGRGEQIKDMLNVMQNVMKIASNVNKDIPKPNEIMTYGGHNQAIGVKIFDPNVFESLRIWSCQNLTKIKQAIPRKKVYPFEEVATIAEYKDICNTYAIFVGGDIKFNDRFYLRIKGNVSKIKEFRNDFMEIALADQSGEEIRFLTKRETGVKYYGLDEKIFEVEIQPVFLSETEYTIGASLKLEKNFFPAEVSNNDFSRGCTMRVR
ncbi:MAG: DHH family phosphoesterase [Paludibacter sp.]|nr:DHH family phosphoesterase [Paludibacter sp.]